MRIILHACIYAHILNFLFGLPLSLRLFYHLHPLSSLVDVVMSFDFFLKLLSHYLKLFGMSNEKNKVD